jgi:hypothetical protein
MKKFAVLFALGLTRSAIAGLDTDPYLYDPTFNGGVIEEDRFAATTSDSYLLGLHLATAANGDIIAVGVVPAAYQASPPANNLGMVRYSATGARIAWSDPTPAYAFFYDHYVDFPNGTGGNIGWVDDIKIQDGYIYVLVDIGPPTGNRDVRVLVFTDAGALVQDMPAFTTPLYETGASLVPYCYDAFNGGPRYCKLIATATYATSAGRQIITMKRFNVVQADGSLTVDNAFGVSNNGAMDQAAPNSLCTAGANCSWVLRKATALRTDTDAPTLYLTGTVTKSSTESDAFVLAVDGYDGSLATTFGGFTGIYVSQNSSGIAVAATTSGDATTDVIYLATYVGESCGAKGSVTKLVQVPPTQVGQLPHTAPDSSWGNGGTRDIGGNPGSCANVFTQLSGMALDGNRLAFSGTEYFAALPTPLFAIVRVSDGALTEFVRNGFPALHANGTPWGGAVFSDVVAAGGGRFATTGYLYDASANNATLFGTARFAPDRIFGDGFE